MTRDLKTRFDGLYKQYKDGLCDVSEINHKNVKELLEVQAKMFFANVRSRVGECRLEVNRRVRESEALRQLEKLVERNTEYFGDNAGAMLENEKKLFD